MSYGSSFCFHYFIRKNEFNVIKMHRNFREIKLRNILKNVIIIFYIYYNQYIYNSTGCFLFILVTKILLLNIIYSTTIVTSTRFRTRVPARESNPRPDRDSHSPLQDELVNHSPASLLQSEDPFIQQVPWLRAWFRGGPHRFALYPGTGLHSERGTRGGGCHGRAARGLNGKSP